MRRVRLSESQLRRVVRKMVRESVEGMYTGASLPPLPAGKMYKWIIGPSTGHMGASEAAEEEGMSVKEYVAKAYAAADQTDCEVQFLSSSDSLLLRCPSAESASNWGHAMYASPAQSWSDDEWLDLLGEPEIVSL
jgi:hypothetical protein